jgi:hypothetical protein
MSSPQGTNLTTGMSRMHGVGGCNDVAAECGFRLQFVHVPYKPWASYTMARYITHEYD